MSERAVVLARKQELAALTLPALLERAGPCGRVRSRRVLRGQNLKRSHAGPRSGEVLLRAADIAARNSLLVAARQACFSRKFCTPRRNTSGPMWFSNMRMTGAPLK
jgi:hypothetical protein